MPPKSKCLDRPKETCKAPCKWDDDKCNAPAARRAVSPNTKAERSVAAKERAAVNPWLAHVKKVRAQNPDLVYSDVLKTASSSYTKVGSPAKSPSPSGRQAGYVKAYPKHQERSRKTLQGHQGTQRGALQSAFRSGLE